ncbi:MAG: PIN domain-containing protein [Gemmataceae bacterium]|nr:PIN domain-containing protein [Gemmataceae bacterium]
MTDRFVDTSGWAAWISPAEPFHALAVAFFDEVLDAGRKLVTTTYVLAELTALFGRLRLPRPQQVGVIDTIRAEPQMTVVPIEPLFEPDARDLWRKRLDKDWSLVDCASFVVMDRLRLTEALTTDHHFEQAGLVRLLK